MTELTPGERRHQRTRDAILETALELIIEKGLDKLSLREIARRVDYSPAGLYEYFGSKDEIIDAVVQQSAQLFASELKRVSTALPVDVYLVELGLAYVRFARQYSTHFKLLFTTLRQQYEPSYETNSEDSYQILVRGVQRAVDSGIFHTHENYGVTEISYTLWALVHGMATLQVTYLDGYQLDFEAADRAGLERFAEGLKRR